MRRGTTVLIGKLGLILLLSQGAAVKASEIKVIASPGVAGVVTELSRQFEAATGHKVLADFAVVAVSKRKIDAGAPFDACLRGCGFFPNRRHARVGWVGAEPQDRFIDLAERVRDGVLAAGVKIDQNEFKPHLTLMRIRDHWPPMAIDTFEKSLADFQSAPFAIHEVTLYLSRLNPQGAVHTPLRAFPLA